MSNANVDDSGPVASPGRHAARPAGSREQESTDEPALAALGISFDGRQYRYETYRYDRREDAVAYAELDRARRAPTA